MKKSDRVTVNRNWADIHERLIAYIAQLQNVTPATWKDIREMCQKANRMKR